MSSDTADVLGPLTAMSASARGELLAFLALSAQVPGRTDQDEQAYFDALLALRTQPRKSVRA